MQAGVFCFFHLWQRHFEFQLACVAMEGSSSVVRNTHARLQRVQISFPTRFLSLLHLASVLLAMTWVGWSFDSFSNFLLHLKQQQNIMFSCIHFPIWPYPPQNNEKTVFYTDKPYGLTGMQLAIISSDSQMILEWATVIRRGMNRQSPTVAVCLFICTKTE